jgi:hypothetical protein
MVGMLFEASFWVAFGFAGFAALLNLAYSDSDDYHDWGGAIFSRTLEDYMSVSCMNSQGKVTP